MFGRSSPTLGVNYSIGALSSIRLHTLVAAALVGTIRTRPEPGSRREVALFSHQTFIHSLTSVGVLSTRSSRVMAMVIRSGQLIARAVGPEDRLFDTSEAMHETSGLAFDVESMDR
jgi:hypothetical protein